MKGEAGGEGNKEGGREGRREGKQCCVARHYFLHVLQGGSTCTCISVVH